MRHSLPTLIRDLHRRRGRERRGLVLAEGVRLVAEALAAGRPVHGAVVSPALEATARGRALKASLAARGASLLEVTDEELAKLADTEHPQGVVAVVEPVAWTWEDIALGGDSAVLVLDGVQDPGNVGTIARTAFGLGAAGLVALKGTAELTNPKVLRGSMGALFRLPAIAAGDQALLTWLEANHVRLWVSAVGGETPRRTAPGPVAIVLGNEGAGVRDSLAAVAERRVGIPLAAGAESLNVAVAAGILLYEVMRER
ncbi:MAG: TrmH family RNA methyltransferase [Gemmatimonadota bacterium]